MAHGPRYTQMAHGGFKSDDRGTWVGLPLETTFFLFNSLSFFSQKKIVFRRVFKKQFKQKFGKRNPESSFCQKREVFREFFVAIVQNVPSDCSQNLRDSGFTEKDRFFEGFSTAI